MHPADDLIERCFAAAPDVRYVAVYWNGELHMRQRAGLTGASTSESDRYEELLVNPASAVVTRISQDVRAPRAAVYRTLLVKK